MNFVDKSNLIKDKNVNATNLKTGYVVKKIHQNFSLLYFIYFHKDIAGIKGNIVHL